MIYVLAAISGEYLGWNSKNVTFVGCTIESNQGMCYMDNVVLRDCKLVNTDLCFHKCAFFPQFCQRPDRRGGDGVGLVGEEGPVDVEKYRFDHGVSSDQ